MKVRKIGISLFLCAVSVGAVLGLVWAADRCLARLAPDSTSRTFEFIYPPGCEYEYASVDFKYDVKINSLGMREREVRPKDAQVVRILGLGDSFTYGWGVQAEETWLRVLEDNLARNGLRSETLNLGKPGAAPPYYADMAARAIPVLHPDIVLVAVLQGDDLISCGPEAPPPAQGSVVRTMKRLFPNLVRIAQNGGRVPEPHPEARNWGTATYKLDAEQNRKGSAELAEKLLSYLTPEQHARYERIDETVRKYFTEGMLNPFMISEASINPDYYKFTLDLGSQDAQLSLARMTTHLRRIREVAQRNGARVLVLSVPCGMYVNESARRNIERVGYATVPEMLTSDSPDKAIALAAGDAQLPLVCVTSEFRKRKDETGLYFPFDYHFTPAGHKLFADLITPDVIKFLRSQLH